ncbi:acetate--CoA ligase family protein [Propylenella binzhouense]|uniref:CoA-binding protein n=1 Tax=Propylenella binzhouense TaxID=2555902 RepID=A0A964T1J3_9HYPH|nr:acetate--CoA ligase family protein [Propylenella binzhouense]MYZ46585.1 CoA-binding protein [Propylenella binzhouense]
MEGAVKALQAPFPAAHVPAFQEALSALFEPRAVAVVGVSRDPIKRGRQVLRNVMRGGFRGKVYAVGRDLQEADGAVCLGDIREAPGPVDVAFLALPADATSRALRDCAEIGVKTAIVSAAGFAESASPGSRARNADLKRTVAETGIRVVGPNCNGIYNTANRLALGFNAAHSVALRPGDIAILSHSGALFSLMMGYLESVGGGLSCFVSAGNEADLDLLDYLEFVLEQESTRVAALLVDAISDGERLRRLGERAAGLGKHIVALKAGLTETGARAALAHSSRLAGQADAYRALFEASGIPMVRSLEGLMSAAAMLSFFGRAPGGLAIMSTSGAGAAILADLAEHHKVPLAEFGPVTQSRLAEYLSFSQFGNPVDLGVFDRARSGPIAEIVAADPAVGAMMTPINGIDPNSGVPTLIRDLASARALSKKPSVLVVPGGLQPEKAAGYLEQGFKVFPDTEAALQGLAAVLHPPPAPCQDGIPGREPAAGEPLLRLGRPLTEPESLALLARFGVPTVQTEVCADLDEAIAAAERLGGRVVAKAVVEGVGHKTEAGLVRVGIRGADAIREAHRAFGGGPMAIQPLVAGHLEMIAGVTRQADVGPILLAGLGGIHAEAIRAVEMWSIPAPAAALERQFANSALGRILRSPRWPHARSADEILAVLARLQDFALWAGDLLGALDVNPFILREDGLVAVDALIIPSAAAEARAGRQETHMEPL